MGDRGNVVVRDQGQDVWLYSHWGGTYLPATVQAALKRYGKSRWTDPSYLARIIFVEMGGGEQGETGYGISTRMCDNEHPIILVNCDTQKVELRSETKDGEFKADDDMTGREWTFDEYVALGEIPPMYDWPAADCGSRWWRRR